MRNKKKNKIFLLLLLLLGITIGFAALATTLKINGNASITKNTWNIYWDNIGNEQGVTPSTATAISADENNVPLSLVTWTVTFDKPGDFYEFQVDAVNAGTLDAEILSIEKKYNGNVISQEHPLPNYLKYVISYADTGEPAVGDKLLKRDDSTNPFTPTRRRYKVRVEYDRDAVTNSDINNQTTDVTCTFGLAVTYGQATPVEIPTIETCPDCVYGWYTSTEQCQVYDDVGYCTRELTNGTNDYTTLKDQQGNQRRAFLGHKLDENNNIIKAYACGIHDDGTAFCIEGTRNGTKYSENQTILREIFGATSEYDPVEDEYIGCNNDATECNSSKVFRATNDDGGNVNVMVRGSYSCSVGSGGIMYCSGT